jgi:hypothetical protein
MKEVLTCPSPTPAFKNMMLIQLSLNFWMLPMAEEMEACREARAFP